MQDKRDPELEKLAEEPYEKIKECELKTSILGDHIKRENQEKN